MVTIPAVVVEPQFVANTDGGAAEDEPVVAVVVRMIRQPGFLAAQALPSLAGVPAEDEPQFRRALAPDAAGRRHFVLGIRAVAVEDNELAEPDVRDANHADVHVLDEVI